MFCLNPFSPGNEKFERTVGEETHLLLRHISSLIGFIDYTLKHGDPRCPLSSDLTGSESYTCVWNSPYLLKCNACHSLIHPLIRHV